MDFNHLLFSLEGRISRKTFWLGFSILAVAGLLLMSALTRLFGIPVEDMALQTSPKRVQLLHLLLGLLTLWPSFAVALKRLHDRNRKTILLVVFFILNFLITLMQYFDFAGTPRQPAGPFLALSLIMLALAVWLIVELGFLRGTNGDNPFGPDPLPSSDAQKK
jgi:uncharacterized membrane protein YhaH (DUF805 family)